jgi:hypothetical protein
MTTVTTLQEDAQAIADLFNNEKVWKIDTISPLFTKHPTATITDVLGFFKKQGSEAYVAAAYFAVKSGVNAKSISISTLNRKIDQDGARLWEKVDVKTNAATMFGEFKRVADAYPAVVPSKDKALIAAAKLMAHLDSINSESLSAEGAAALMALRSRKAEMVSA